MRNWPWALLAHALLLQLATFVVRPAAAYRALELGVQPALLGLIAASFAIVPLLVAVLVGRATDAGRDPEVLCAGAVLLVAAGVGLLLSADSLMMLLLWNVVVGLGHLMCVLGQQTLVARNAAHELDSAFGRYTFAGSAGQAAGPALIVIFGGAAAIPDTGGLFAAYTASCAGLLVLTLPLVRTGRAAPARTPTTSRPLRQALGDTTGSARRRLLGAMTVSMMVVAAIDLITVYLPALGVERDIPAAAIGLLLSLRALATMASRLGLGPLVSCFGRGRLVAGSAALSALAVGALAVPMPVWALGLVLALAGIGLGVGQPLTLTVISLVAPAGTRGAWLGLRLSANRFGQSAIPAGVGLVAGAAGVAGVFAATALGLALLSAGSWLGLRRSGE